MNILVAVDRIVRDSSIPMMPRAVLRALAARADAGGLAWPSLARIAEDVGIARSTAIVAVGYLTERGLIASVARSSLCSASASCAPTAWKSS